MHKRGFTLIELMMVVAITGVLASASYSTYKRLVGRSYSLEAQIFLASMYRAEEVALTEAGTYASCLNFLGHDPGNPIFHNGFKAGFGNGRYLHGFHLTSPTEPNDYYESAVSCTGCCMANSSYSSIFFPKKLADGLKVELEDAESAASFNQLLMAPLGPAQVDVDGLGYTAMAATYFSFPISPESLDRWSIDQDKNIIHLDMAF